MTKSKYKEFYGVCLDGEYVSVLHEKAEANEVCNLKNEIDRHRFFEEHEEEYGEEQLLEMWKHDGNHYQLEKLKLVPSSVAGSDDWTTWEYENEYSNDVYSGSELKDLLLEAESLENELDQLQETLEELAGW